MQLPDRRWTVSCAACEIVVGSFEGGRFVHAADCTQPIAIGRGTMRCCRCGGELAVAEELSGSQEVAEPDEPVGIHELAGGLSAVRVSEARLRS